MENLLQAHSVKRKPPGWREFFYNTLFCLAIAGVLEYVDYPYTPLFGDTVIVSLSIGWSIHLAYHLLGGLLDNFFPVYFSVILLTAIGLSVGLLIAGTIVAGNPLLFFQDNYTSLVLGVFFGIVGLVIFSTRENLAKVKAQLTQARINKQQQEKLQLETELKLLQAQIEPHFLFNTLSNVIGLVHTKPLQAEQTLINLTTLLRSSLQRTREQSVTLVEEFTIVKAYLDIQKIRMQGRLSYTFSPGNFTDDLSLKLWPLAPLLVQPIVENAVLHGIDPSESGGSIHVDAKVVESNLLITIADSGLGICQDGPAKESSGMGAGLSNVRSRLKILYGDAASLTVADNKPTGVIVTLLIPRKEQ